MRAWLRWIFNGHKQHAANVEAISGLISTVDDIHAISQNRCQACENRISALEQIDRLQARKEAAKIERPRKWSEFAAKVGTDA